MRHITWVLGTALAASALLLIPMAPTARAPVENFSPAPARAEAFVVTGNGAAGMTKVFDGAGKWTATFTPGARTVALAGPERTFAEATAGAAVVTSTYVRLLPEPFTGDVDVVWLRSAMTDPSPDLLAIAAQYVRQAPALFDGAALQTAGDAGYGPASEDGNLRKGADFNDYLGIAWDYAGESDEPEADELGALDCSGFVRMVFGYRGGMPMTRDPADGFLPRRSFEMLDAGPGSIIHRSAGRLEELAGIQPGDLVFFDAAPDAAGQIDHVGVFVGVDTKGNHRFISSRKTADGPTMGDEGGRSILDGTGHYAEAWRGVRRL
jgi:cell wall-associated NlpC family hydrolase